MDVGGGARLRCMYLAEAQETFVRSVSFPNTIILLKQENTPTEM